MTNYLSCVKTHQHYNPSRKKHSSNTWSNTLRNGIMTIDKPCRLNATSGRGVYGRFVRYFSCTVRKTRCYLSQRQCLPTNVYLTALPSFCVSILPFPREFFSENMLVWWRLSPSPSLSVTVFSCFPQSVLFRGHSRSARNWRGRRPKHCIVLLIDKSGQQPYRCLCMKHEW